jgi:hypothetical protein
MSNPGIHNMYEIYRNMYSALGVRDIDSILNKPDQPTPKDPALEHVDALAGKPFQAFPGQDHRAHITSHLSFMSTNLAKNAPVVMASLEKNVFEHISLMGQEQVELEFRNEIAQVAQMTQNPQAQQDPQTQAMVQNMQQKIESRKAQIISEAMEEFMSEENKIMSIIDNDPIAMLRSRELDLRAQENASKERDSQERINLDKMKTMMNQSTDSQKLQQNEDLAKLRANTSLEKTILAARLKNNQK